MLLLVDAIVEIPFSSKVCVLIVPLEVEDDFFDGHSIRHQSHGRLVVSRQRLCGLKSKSPRTQFNHTLPKACHRSSRTVMLLRRHGRTAAGATEDVSRIAGPIPANNISRRGLFQSLDQSKQKCRCTDRLKIDSHSRFHPLHRKRSIVRRLSDTPDIEDMFLKFSKSYSRVAQGQVR